MGSDKEISMGWKGFLFLDDAEVVENHHML